MRRAITEPPSGMLCPVKNIVLLCALLIFAVGVSHCATRRTVYRAFPPSHASLLAQNAEIDRLGLQRYENDEEVSAAVGRGDLVPIGTGSSLQVARSLPSNRRYCRPWTYDFLFNMSYDFWSAFGQPLQVNSAVRTVRVQRSLTHWNHNAAPAHGDTSSSHLAGLTVDIARRGLSKKQITWVENYLLARRDQVIVEEEIQQPCFHVCVRGQR
jgi:hypothetical protein